MHTKKLLLAIDWTNIMFRSFFMSQTFNKGNSIDEDMNSFIVKLGTDLCYLFKVFKPDKAIMMTDGRNPWRKDILPGEYKSTRVRDSGIDWERVFETANALKDLMKSKGYEFGIADRCEADDMLCMAKEAVFEQGKDWNIILVSSDADIRQLVDFNQSTKQYCCVYNPIPAKGGNRHFYVSKEFFKWYMSEEEPTANDIFFMNSGQLIDKNRIKEILNETSKTKMELIDPNGVVLEKIFCGDKSDNVPSIYTWYTKSGKKSRITELKYSKIKESLLIETVSDLEAKLPFLKESIEAVIKKELDDVDLNERVNTQKTLVELKSSNFPEAIRAYKADLINMVNSSALPPMSIASNVHELFDGTEWKALVDKDRAIESAVFKTIDKYYTDNFEEIFK